MKVPPRFSIKILLHWTQTKNERTNMLILSRKVQESVELVWNGPPLMPGTKLGRVVVLSIDRDQMKMGFECVQDLVLIRDNVKKSPPPYTPAPVTPITKTVLPANINLKRI